MRINSISASRQKTYEKCQYKYLLTYCLFTCQQCKETFYDVEFKDDKCPYCKSESIKKIEMKSNWGAAHGTALHWILENYANACRGTFEDGSIITDEDKQWMLDWQNQIGEIYKRGHKHQNNPKFSILDLAKPKDFNNVDKICQSCPFFKNKICEIAGINPDDMDGCPRQLYADSINLMTAHMSRMDKIYKKKKILGVEAAFTLDLGCIDEAKNPMKALGFMDFVYEVDKETIEMIDYKFGAHTQTYDEVYNDIQAKIYSVALKQLFPGYETYLLTFDYMRGQPVTVTYCQEQDDKTKEDLIKTWVKIQEPQSVSRNLGWWCNAMCDKKLCDREWPKFKQKFAEKDENAY